METKENFQGWRSFFSVTLNTLNVLIIKDQVLKNPLNHTNRLNIMLQYKKKFIKSISEFLAWHVYTLMRKIDTWWSKRDSTLCHYLNLLKISYWFICTRGRWCKFSLLAGCKKVKPSGTDCVVFNKMACTACVKLSII